MATVTSDPPSLPIAWEQYTDTPPGPWVRFRISSSYPDIDGRWSVAHRVLGYSADAQRVVVRGIAGEYEHCARDVRWCSEQDGLWFDALCRMLGAVGFVREDE